MMLLPLLSLVRIISAHQGYICTASIGSLRPPTKQVPHCRRSTPHGAILPRRSLYLRNRNKNWGMRGSASLHYEVTPKTFLICCLGRVKPIKNGNCHPAERGITKWNPFPTSRHSEIFQNQKVPASAALAFMTASAFFTAAYFAANFFTFILATAFFTFIFRLVRAERTKAPGIL